MKHRHKILNTSEQEACIAKSLKQLMTHCCISNPRASSVFTVESRRPGFAPQQTSTLVSPSLLSTSNYNGNKENIRKKTNWVFYLLVLMNKSEKSIPLFSPGVVNFTCQTFCDQLDIMHAVCQYTTLQV